MISYKIRRERELKGWSVEVLADKLGVSIDKITNWEQGNDVPEITHVAKMAELFGVTADYLIKEEVAESEVKGSYSNNRNEDIHNKKAGEKTRLVTMKDAEDLFKMKKEGGTSVANAVLMCILSPVLLIVLGALTEVPSGIVSEKIASVAGLTLMFLMIAFAVYKLITFGISHKRLEYFEREIIELATGVKEMTLEKRKAFEPVFGKGLATGVILCILSVIPLIVAGALDAPDYLCGILAGVMLSIIAIGVRMIIIVCFINGSYNMVLQEGDYTKENKEIENRVSLIATAYWCTATAI